MVNPALLVEFWTRNWNRGALQIPDEDLPILKKFHHFDDTMYNKPVIDKNFISTALPPYPYGGDLRNARVYMVLMNPGLN